jgi:two-component system, OmpR family, sensor kinase
VVTDLLAGFLPMDVLFDYDPANSPGPEARARERADQLIACYQQALGHELPNLLVALQGLARLLAEEQADRLDPEGLALLDRLAELARRADMVARATAAVGRACRDAGSAAPVPLSDAVREALAEVNLLSIGGVVEYDVAGDMPALSVSRRSLHQVLVQLLGNAARAGVPGRPLRVAVNARRTPVGIELRIADNGRGLPKEVSRRLAEPFTTGGSQVSGPVAKPGGGIGLGLFQVRQIVAGWGGALRVASEPGSGTAVTVLFRGSFPAHPEPEPETRLP